MERRQGLKPAHLLMIGLMAAACLAGQASAQPAAAGAAGEIVALVQTGSNAAARGDAGGAEQAFRQAVARAAILRLSDDPAGLSARSNLAKFLSDAERYAEAEPLWRALWLHWRASEGDQANATMTAANFLGASLAGLGRHQDAAVVRMTNYDAALARFGAKDEATLHIAADLTVSLRAARRYQDALPVQRALTAAYTEREGAEGETALASREWEGWLQARLGNRTEAEAIERQVLDAYRRGKGAGADHLPDVQIELARTLEATRRFPEAVDLRREVVTEARARYGPESLEAVDSENHLVIALVYADRALEAEPIARHVAAGFRRLKGPDSVDTLDAMQTLAGVLFKTDRTAEAQGIVSDALAIQRRKASAPGAPVEATADLLHLTSGLGALYASIGRYDEAAVLDRQAYEGLRALVGEENDETLSAATGLGSALAALGQLDEAALLLDRVEKTRSRLKGDEDPGAISAKLELADVFYKAGQYGQAGALQMEAFRARSKVFGPTARETLAAINNAAITLEAMGDSASAAQVLGVVARNIEARTNQGLDADPGALGHVYFNLGTAEAHQAHYQQAYDALAKSASIVSARYRDTALLASDDDARSWLGQTVDVFTAQVSVAWSLAHQP